MPRPGRPPQRPRNNLLTLAILLFSGAVNLFAGAGTWTVVAWNNLGMHCMDDDYSVFSILPPFNTLDAQVINASGKLVTDPAAAGITVTYEMLTSPDGSINTTSAGKTNFYEHVAATYGATLSVDQGLAGNPMPGPANTPRPMNWIAAQHWFEAAGIPITPIDDRGQKNPYPLARVSARNASGVVLASADVVVPVSDEMDCRACHRSDSGPGARPAGGWVNDPADKRDFRLNILRLHDEKHAADPAYAAALAAQGYPSQGLFFSAQNAGHPVLCASCHASEALGTGGQPGVQPLTRAMHGLHANVRAPANGLLLNDATNRSACYLCHPGSETRCLRGAMGAAVDPVDGSLVMQCQSCHGAMSAVGSANRTGWLDEPNCQACHTGDALANSGQIRFTSAFDSFGALRVPANRRFATAPDTPAPGKSLFRFSQGHGGLTCSACHGSTHAEYPSRHRDDNLYSWNKQGHAGKLVDCTVCHASMPSNSVGGPHGLHPVGSQNWVLDHANIARSVGINECRECHGADYRGTELSRAQADRSLSTKFGVLTLRRGMEVSCYYCHNGPSSSDPSTHAGPTVAAARLALAADTPAPLVLTASGVAPKLRVIRQPLHGSVGISGLVATYFPDAGYTGPDSFSYIASDSGSYIDSRPAEVAITVGPVDPAKDSDGDGLGDWLEYALGLDPALRSAPMTSFLKTTAGQNYLVLRAPLSPIRPAEMTLSISASGDLKNWAPLSSATTRSDISASDTTPVAPGAPRFLRLEAVRAP